MIHAISTSSIPLNVEMLEKVLEAQEKLRMEQVQPLIYIGEAVGNLFRAITKSDFPGCCEFLKSLDAEPETLDTVQRVRNNVDQMISMFLPNGGGE